MRVAFSAMAALLVLGCDSSGSADAPPRATAAQRVDAQPASTAKAGDPVVAKTQAQPDDAMPDPQAEEPSEPQFPKPPQGYGALSPSDVAPDPSALTVHAVAGYEVVAVYDKPDVEAHRLGYLRLGQRLMVTPKIEGKDCPKGFHQLPEGGYACASRGLIVDAKREPYLHQPPPPPSTDAPVPYEYAYVRRWNIPMYRRAPTAKEYAAAEDKRAALEAERLALADPEAGPVATSKPAPAAPADAKPHKELPSVDDAPSEPKPQVAAEPKPAQPKAAADPAAAAPEPEPEPAVVPPLHTAKPWLERGFYIALGGKLRKEGRSWWRTARGAYVESKYAGKVKPKDFEGRVLEEGQTFPFGFVMQKDGTRLLELQPDGKLRGNKMLERRTFVDLTEETEVKGKAYMMTTDGMLIRKSHLRLAEPQQIPEGLEPYDRWVDVSKSKQMLVAYEGVRPVFTTLVSTGKKGSKEDPFETPTGRWRVRSKHISTTMDGNTASDGNYSIQDVPWAMFFDGSYALHGAFWHAGFGRVRSHGCVNLGPTDARWLFAWTTPVLPEGWHGVHAHEGSPGTTVVVRD